jgi:hypothetical protein
LDVIDLDVFVPEPKPTKFTDKEGFELKRKRRALEMEFGQTNDPTSIFARVFGKRKAIEAKIKKVDAEIKRHTHVVDISSASFGSSMYVLKHIDEFKRLETIEPDKVTDREYRLVLGIVADACSKQGAKVTVDYLIDNLHVSQGLVMMQLVMRELLGYIQSNFLAAAGTETEK